MSSSTSKELPILSVAGWGLFFLVGLMIAVASEPLGPVVLVAWGLALVARAPALAALFLVGWGAFRFGTGVYAAPLIIGLAGWEMLRKQRALFNRLDYLRLAGTAGVVIFVSLLVSGLSYSIDVDGRGIWNGADNSGESTGDSGDDGDGAGNGQADNNGSEFDDPAALGNASSGLGSEFGNGSGVGGLSEDGRSMWDVAKWALLVVAMVIVVAWWAHLQPKAEEIAAIRGPDPAELVRRLEAVGARLGLARQDSETVLAYTEHLSKLTNDERFRDVGRMISAIVYGNDEAAANGIEDTLSAIEVGVRQPVA